MMPRAWILRKFEMEPGFNKIIKAGKKIKIDDKYFPFKTQDINEIASVCRVKGMIPIHRDRSQDQSYCGAFYPWHEGMIWNFILWVSGNPALMLGEQRPKVIPLQPGMAIWFDITETFHAITQLSDLHPRSSPEIVFVQVAGQPGFLYESALRELKEEC